MGAMSFTERGEGKTLREAYDAALGMARHRDGHGGYSGSLAVKSGLPVEYLPPAGMTPEDWYRLICESCDWPFEPDDEEWCSAEDIARRDEVRAKLGHADFERLRRASGTYNDKWSESVAIPIAPGAWMFCGLASS